MSAENKGAFGALVFFIVFMGASVAHGEMQFRQGWWKAELTGGLGVNATSHSDRTGDVLVTGVAEYEFPAASHFTMGLRFVPLFLYEQDGEDDLVWGGGLGLAVRLYLLAREYRGLYTELESHGIVHENKIMNNSSNFNFLIAGGLGYRFRTGWHGAVKFEHISNAGLGKKNSGTDTISLAVGATF